MIDKKFTTLIGIDTGVNTGLCVYNRSTKKIESLVCVPIHNAMELVLYQRFLKKTILVRVEDARLRQWIPKQKTIRGELARAAGGGSIKRDAKIFEDFLKDKGIPFEMVAPKNNKTKLSADYFRKLTGWQGSTNSHMRDAGMLCYGY